MRYSLVLLFFFALNYSNAQLLDSIAIDTVKTFTSLESALKHPEQVYKLKLQKEGLTKFPMEILQFKNLQVLDLSKNKIEEIPEEIEQLGNLTSISFSKNRLVSIPPSIGKLVHLKVLVLNQNEIDSIPNEIGNLVHLVYLDMWSNNLSYFPKELRKLVALKEFDLRHIQMNQKEQDYISSLLPKTKIHFSPTCNCK